jgi:hypothetical protein
MLSTWPTPLQTLLAALMLPPERFSKVHRCAIFFPSLPLPLLLGGLLSVGEASQLTLLPPADSPTVVEGGQKSKAIRAMRPRMFLIAPSSSPRKAIWSQAWSSSLRALIKSGENYFSRHIMSLSKFHDTLSPIILHFDSDIGNRSLCGEISLICC